MISQLCLAKFIWPCSCKMGQSNSMRLHTFLSILPSTITNAIENSIHVHKDNSKFAQISPLARGDQFLLAENSQMNSIYQDQPSQVRQHLLNFFIWHNQMLFSTVSQRRLALVLGKEICHIRIDWNSSLH